MTDETTKKLIANKPGFIALRRYGFSMKRLEKRYPNGDCPDRVVVAALKIKEEDIPGIEDFILKFCRAGMKVVIDGQEAEATED